jgi:hypothetical protein
LSEGIKEKKYFVAGKKRKPEAKSFLRVSTKQFLGS